MKSIFAEYLLPLSLFFIMLRSSVHDVYIQADTHNTGALHGQTQTLLPVSDRFIITLTL